MSDITALLGTALNNDMLAMRVISQNLANINTDGYKSEIAFSSLLTPPSSLTAPGNEVTPLRWGRTYPASIRCAICSKAACAIRVVILTSQSRATGFLRYQPIMDHGLLDKGT